MSTYSYKERTFFSLEFKRKDTNEDGTLTKRGKYWNRTWTLSILGLEIDFRFRLRPRFSVNWLWYSTGVDIYLRYLHIDINWNGDWWRETGGGDWNPDSGAPEYYEAQWKEAHG